MSFHIEKDIIFLYAQVLRFPGQFLFPILREVVLWCICYVIQITLLFHFHFETSRTVWFTLFHNGGICSLISLESMKNQRKYLFSSF